MMPRRLTLLLPGLFFTACGAGSSAETQVYYPVVTTSASTLAFDQVAWGQTQTKRITVMNSGDRTMGVGDITLNTDEMEDNWSISFDFTNVDCPNSGTDTGAGDGGAGDGGAGDGGTTATGTDGGTADGGTTDGGTTDGGTTDGGTTDGGTTDGGTTDGGTTDGGTLSMFAASAVDTGGWWSGDGGTEEAAAQVLDPGCKLPIDVTLAPLRIGQIYGSVTIETVDVAPAEGEDQTIWADPNNSQVTIILSGEGDKGAPNIYVSPRALDFGTVWSGDGVSLLVSILNAGAGDLTIQPPYLDSDACDPGFSLDWALGAETTLVPDALTGVEIAFTAPDDSSAKCTLWLQSDDPDEPYVDVPLQANVGTDLQECYPQLNLIQPTVGYEHLNGQDLDVVFQVSDCNQPADTIALQIRSGVLNVDSPQLVDTFYAPDESGYVEAKVPRDLLLPGTDTIVVRATDSAGQSTDATASFLYRATFPASDDDGDGYGSDGETADDCDDGDINTYPGAIERYDAKDNDCDGTIDEGTAGSDDDGDGFAESEGDCDDADAATYPGAEEIPDYRDNNCDGATDEGTTLADDDGDGYAESEGDCDDTDAAVNPAAIEYCDGIDNDCNGLSDERDGCVDLDSDPIVIGGCRTDKTTISVGEQAHLSVFTFDGDGDATSYAWTPDAKLTAQGFVALDNVASATPTFTAPTTIAGNKSEETYTFALLASDPGGHTAYCNVDVRVTLEPVELYTIDTVSTSSGGCGGGGSSGAALMIPGLLGLLALGRRRRHS